MKTLKESILDDIDIQMKAGDKYAKEYKVALSDIKSISNCINNFDPNSASTKWYMWKNDLRKRATIFFKTPKLTKYFNLPGKHIFVAVTFHKYSQEWNVSIIFTNANKTILDHRQNHLECIRSIQGSVSYIFEEKNIPKDKASKFSMDEFIQKYVNHMFSDIESFEKYVVEPCIKGINPNKEII